MQTSLLSLIFMEIERASKNNHIFIVFSFCMNISNIYTKKAVTWTFVAPKPHYCTK